MKKQQKNLLIMCSALVLVIAAFFVVKFINNIENADKRMKVFDIKKESITKMSYHYNHTDYVFVKSDGKWHWESYPKYNVNQKTVDKMLDKFVDLKAGTKFDATNLSDYMLDSSNVRIVKLYDDKNNIYTVKIGDFIETSNEYYILTSNSSSVVYTVDDDFVSAFSKLPEDF